MESSQDKKWARTSLLSSVDGESVRGEKKSPTSGIRSITPDRASSRLSTSSTIRPGYSDYKSQPFPNLDDRSVGRSSVRDSSEIPTSTVPAFSTAPPSTYDGDMSRRRGVSLSSRYPGDSTHQPLDMIRRDSRRANRAPHLRRDQHHGTDLIDKMAGLDMTFHHDGPYDAASLARNRRYKNSPLQALESSNREALRAVPREKVVDSIARHRPLDGFAFVPPGFPDQDGRVLNYKEGTDMHRHNGADYRRWPGLNYHPDDLKGKSEPSYSIERALKTHKLGQSHRRVFSEPGIEMDSGLGRSRSLHVAGSGNEPRYSEWESDIRRDGTTGRAEGLMRRIGSLRRRKPVGETHQESPA